MEEARDGLVDIAAVFKDQTGHLKQMAHVGNLRPLAGLISVPRKCKLRGARQARLVRFVESHHFPHRGTPDVRAHTDDGTSNLDRCDGGSIEEREGDASCHGRVESMVLEDALGDRLSVARESGSCREWPARFGRA